MTTPLDTAGDWCDEHAVPAVDCTGDHQGRQLIVQRANSVTPRRVSWLWDGRIAAGTLSLLAGGEGLGKSTLTAWLVAAITRGTLPGDEYGTPRSVIIAATEDSWEHTLVPRLMAAGADLSRVLQVDVQTSEGFITGLSLPKDIEALADLARVEGVALLVLDPIMSRLEGLDTHKDSEVRRALEPLVKAADAARMAVLGLIHVNKSGAADPLRALMGSRAFPAVARSVSTVVADPEDEDDRRRLFGTVKNNLGPISPSSDVFTVDTATVPSPDGPISTGLLEWHGSVDTTVKAAMADAAAGGGMETQGALAEACEWLRDYLDACPGEQRQIVIREGQKEGHSLPTIKRAAHRLGVVSVRKGGQPPRSLWSLPTEPNGSSPGESVCIEPMEPMGSDLQVRSAQSGSIGSMGPRDQRPLELEPMAEDICPGCGDPACTGECGGGLA